MTLQTDEPTRKRVVVPAHKLLRVGTLNAILRQVAEHKGVTREDILATLRKRNERLRERMLFGRGDDFVSDQVHADVSGFGTIEVKSVDRLFNVLSEFGPGVTLCENRFGRAFGAVPAVCLLGDLEDQFIHITTLVEIGDVTQ